MQCQCCENYTFVDTNAGDGKIDLVIVAPERPQWATAPNGDSVPCREMRVTLTLDQMRALAASLLGAAGIATIVGED